jgi:MFS family permease
MGEAVFTITALAFFRVPILPSIGDDLAISTTQLGMFTATYALGRLLTDVPAGAMADRLPATSIVSRAAWLVAAGSALLAGAPVALVAYAAIFVLGVGTAVTNTSGAAYFSTVRAGVPPGDRRVGVCGRPARRPGVRARHSRGLTSFGGWRTAEAIAVAVAVGLVAAVASRARGGTVTAHERRRSGDGAGPTAQWVLSRSVRIVLFSVPFVMFLTIGSMIQTLAPVIGRRGARPHASCDRARRRARRGVPVHRRDRRRPGGRAGSAQGSARSRLSDPDGRRRAARVRFRDPPVPDCHRPAVARLDRHIDRDRGAGRSFDPGHTWPQPRALPLRR